MHLATQPSLPRTSKGDLEIRKPPPIYPHVSKVSEKAAENGALWRLVLTSFPPRPKHVSPRRFKLVLCFCAKVLQFRVFTRWLVSDILSFPPFSHKRPIFGSLTSGAEMDFSRPLTGHGSRYIVKG
jgi:hypothetical protein